MKKRWFALLLGLVIAACCLGVLSGCQDKAADGREEHEQTEERKEPEESAQDVPVQQEAQEPVSAPEAPAEIKMYAQYPEIPDYGAVTGLTLLQEQNGAYLYYVPPEGSGNVKEHYAEALRDSGFAYYATLEDGDGNPIQTYTSDQYTVMWGDHSGDKGEYTYTLVYITGNDDEGGAETEPQATTGEKNALRSAQSYVELMGFSRSGLIEQLEYEGYSNAEAVYGADHCGADWYEEAAESAASYLDVMSFSKTGLIEQLEYEGFTHDQAVYGVEQNGY